MNELDEINQAVKLLKQGKLVSFPTETVYGLGADAKNPEALKKIFKAKGRPEDHPLIIHIADISQLADWARDIPETAYSLAKIFWPGPLTLILKKAKGVSDLVTGGQDTVGIRIPNHPLALSLLKKFGGGLAAPSANKFGRISPTTFDAVKEELNDAVDLVLDGGACPVGVESTILDLSGDEPIILRPGMLTNKELETVLEKPLAQKKSSSPRVSGSLESHYAPRTPTSILSLTEILYLLKSLSEFPIALVSHHEFAVDEKCKMIKMSRNAKQYAHDLYQTLRELDKQNFKKIIIEAVPNDGEWDAVRDRLMRMG